MAKKKATKKFESKHLTDVLKRRKKAAPDRLKFKARLRKQAGKLKRSETAGNEPDKGDNGEKHKRGRIEEVDDGDLLTETFEALQPSNGAQPHHSSPSHLGKRKRSLNGGRENGAEVSKESEEDSDQRTSPAVEDALSAQEKHQAQLKALEENDPEFYEFLRENDEELLNFTYDRADDPSADVVQDEEKEKEITMAMVQRWRAGIDEHKSLRSAKEVVLGFRAAVKSDDAEKEFKYRITNSDVYHKLLTLALEHIPSVIEHHLPVEEGPHEKLRVETDSKKFRALKPLFISFTSCVLQLLANLSGAATIRLTVDALLPILPYLFSFKKLVRELTRVVSDVWSDAANTQATRISAFLVLRRLAAIGDPSMRENVLRATYQGLLKGCRISTVHTLPGINLMKNSAAELWGVDATTTYTIAFKYIRQLAIHLRGAMKNNANESFKTVYNWQYVHSIDFWTRTLALHCGIKDTSRADDKLPLQPLIYPTVQIALGAIRLYPTPQYYPFRFQMVRSMLRIAYSTNTYIPLAPLLYDVLASAEMEKAPKPSTLKAVDFTTAIRVSKSYLKTRVYQDGLGEQVVELYSEFLVHWSKSIAFPELVLPIIFMLRKWLKRVSDRATGNKNLRLNSTLTLLVQKLEANASWIEERRAKVTFAPNDREGVNGFLADTEWDSTPLGVFVANQRKLREQRRRDKEAVRDDQ